MTYFYRAHYDEWMNENLYLPTITHYFTKWQILIAALTFHNKLRLQQL